MKEYKISSMHIEYFETEKLKALTVSRWNRKCPLFVYGNDLVSSQAVVRFIHILTILNKEDVKSTRNCHCDLFRVSSEKHFSEIKTQILNFVSSIHLLLARSYSSILCW